MSRHNSSPVIQNNANFEMAKLEIIRINFDDIWQKYSKDSRIEFACVSFHVGLLFYQLFIFQCNVFTRNVLPFLPLAGLTADTACAAVESNTTTTGALLHQPFLQLGTETSNKRQVTHLQKPQLFITHDTR